MHINVLCIILNYWIFTALFIEFIHSSQASSCYLFSSDLLLPLASGSGSLSVSVVDMITTATCTPSPTHARTTPIWKPCFQTNVLNLVFLFKIYLVQHLNILLKSVYFSSYFCYKSISGFLFWSSSADDSLWISVFPFNFPKYSNVCKNNKIRTKDSIRNHFLI